MNLRQEWRHDPSGKPELAEFRGGQYGRIYVADGIVAAIEAEEVE